MLARLTRQRDMLKSEDFFNTSREHVAGDYASSNVPNSETHTSDTNEADFVDAGLFSRISHLFSILLIVSTSITRQPDGSDGVLF